MRACVYVVCRPMYVSMYMCNRVGYVYIRVSLKVMAKTFCVHFKRLTPKGVPFMKHSLQIFIPIYCYLLVAQWGKIFIYYKFFAKVGAFGQMCIKKLK